MIQKESFQNVTMFEACLQTQPLNTPLNSINEQLLQ